jgi:hypothetical protein
MVAPSLEQLQVMMVAQQAALTSFVLLDKHVEMMSVL